MLIRCLTLGLAVAFLTVSPDDLVAKDRRGGGTAPKASAVPKASAHKDANKQRDNLQKKQQVRGSQKAYE